MTLGVKIREARSKCGLSQEKLAEKMSVSRSAIAKWETDKGLPDVGTLKVLARLLNVSVDYLLDDTETGDPAVIRECYNLAAYGRGCKKMRKDRVVRQKFPEDKIYALFGRQEPVDLAQVCVEAVDCRFDVQTFLKNTDKAFYLIEKEDRQLFVTVTDTHVEIRPMEQPMTGSSFRLGDWTFVKNNYEISGE